MPVVLTLRISPRPPSATGGSLAQKLTANQAHARCCAWVPARTQLSHGTMNDSALTSWINGRGPMGVRLGLTFVDESGQVFARHGAAGELSATIGLAGDSITPWVRALEQATEGRVVQVDIDGEVFQISTHGDHIEIAATDEAGDVDSPMRFHAEPLRRSLEAELELVPLLATAAANAGFDLALEG